MENVSSADNNWSGNKGFCYAGRGYQRMLAISVHFVQKWNRLLNLVESQQDILVLN